VVLSVINENKGKSGQMMRTLLARISNSLGYIRHSGTRYEATLHIQRNRITPGFTVSIPNQRISASGARIGKLLPFAIDHLAYKEAYLIDIGH
jgi:hypothetical protein